ncbi:MAG: FAD-dependent monooxygenase [Alphaproteobacteria bacterium]|nr:FAD-dependent monooxygenase [Alphaproteobacteria bacterium]
MSPGRAVVAGGSIGGLLAGLLLHRAGWTVTICERAGEALASRGAGIVTHPELHAAMVAAGADLSEGLGIAVDGRVVLARDGTAICAAAMPQVLTSWGRAYRFLRAACPEGIYLHGKALERIAERGGTVAVHLGDGSVETADLLVAADGVQSTARRLLFPAAAPRYVGYCAWRGLLDERALSPAAHAQLFRSVAFCLPSREQMLGYPVAGADEELTPGRRRFNFVWYRPADPAGDMKDLFTGSDGRDYGSAIPPHRIRPDVIDRMRDDAGRLLAPAFAEVVRKTPQPFLQAIFDLETPSMAVGRTALLGDAAFVARPHVGLGVTKAAGDAVALVRALAEHADVPAALAAYDAERRPYGARAIRRARHLGAYLQAQLLSPEERAQAELHRSPRAVMLETAVVDDIERW